MKILYVVRNLDRYSGAATQALNLAREINNNKVLVDIVNVSDSEKLRTLAADIDGVSINHLSRKAAGLLSFFKIVFKYDVVHFHGMFIVHMLIAKLVGKKVVLKTTLSGEDDFSAIHKRKFGRLRIAILNRIVDINNSLTSDLAIVNSGYMPKNSIVTIPNFVSVNESDVKKINLFIFVGAIVKRKHPLKAINYFLDNYAHLEESMLYLVGPSNIQENVEDAVYLSEIVEKSRQHPDKVVLTGNLTHEEVLKLYKKAKALLFFSEREGMPNSVLEAMANNCVPITGSIGGVARDIITDTIDGFIVGDVNSKPVRIEDIEMLISDCKPMSKVKERFSFDVGVQIYCKLYESMFTSPKSHR